MTCNFENECKQNECPCLYVGELGYHADGNAGMFLLTQRWYNPVVGRFVVRDPLTRRGDMSFKQDIVPYAYVKENPVNAFDPDGLFTKGDCYRWFFRCMDDAQKEYERCKKYIEGGGEITIGCHILCELVCWPAEAAGGPGAHAFCAVVCTPICENALTGITTRSCKEMRNIMEESCRNAFRWCMKHADCTSH